MNVDASAAERFRTTVDLFETGVRLRRAALKRELPQASDAEIEERLGAWLRERPGAPDGDGPPPSR